MAERLLMLDRDGVINEDSDRYVKCADEWVPIPGSIDAIARIYHAGFKICVITNQSGIGRGFFSLEMLEAMHRKLANLVEEKGARIELIGFCPHLPEEHCLCRKPRPGLLLSVLDRFGLDPNNQIFIGDSLVDVEAAKAAGVQPWLVRTGKGARTLALGSERLRGVPVFECLSEAADHLLEMESSP